VQKSGLSALDIDKLDRGELCDLLEAMGCPTDYTAARHHTKTDGGCNVDELRRAAKHMMRGACAVPGWCSADADAFTDSPMLNRMSFVRDSMHSSSSNSAHCALVIFTSAISMHRLKRWLARKKKNTAPGVSGVRVDHLAAAPTRALRAWARILSTPYVARCMYSAWAEEIVN